MMKVFRSTMLSCALLLSFANLQNHALTAAEAASNPAMWTADSTTAMGITGDIGIGAGSITLAGKAYPLRFARSFSGDDIKNAATMFSVADTRGAYATLYTTSIPADAALLRGNTLCGATAATYIVLFTTPKPPSLEMAVFSGTNEPNLKPATIATSKALCGTFGYSSKIVHPLPQAT